MRRAVLLLASAGCLLPACGPTLAEDGVLGSGGSATGGGPSAFTGGAASGGAVASGGTPASGGSAAGGSASGGALGSGGAAESSGGSAGGGGSAGSGGSAGGGGSAPSGGAAATGGSGSGGASGTGGDSGGCAFSGHIEYELNGPESWPSDVTPLITAAMDSALEWYNCYADLTKSITVNYNPGVPTAEANVDGTLSFGSNKSYMQVATAMHEVAHTLGVAYYPWSELIDDNDGVWTGPNVDAFISNLPAEERDADTYSQRDYITCDGQHFWPYGLNQASEHQSDWSLINHVRIVAAMQLDKQAYLDGL